MSIPIVLFGGMRKHLYVCVCFQLFANISLFGISFVYADTCVLLNNHISVTCPDLQVILYLKPQIG